MTRTASNTRPCKDARHDGAASLLSCLLLVLALVCPVPAAALEIAKGRVVVIGNAGLGVEVLSQEVVRDLYLGKTVQLFNGNRIEIVDLPIGHPVRNSFYIHVIGRDPSQMRAYWAKRIFTGKGSPPSTRPDERSVVHWVAGGRGRIAYVSADAVDERVKILLIYDGGQAQ